MAKSKSAQKYVNISPERLVGLRRKNLIESGGSSLRLSGTKVTNEQVEQILNEISKSSAQK